LPLSEEGTKLLTLCCPYWSRSEDHPEQDNGYCAYIEEGDWEGERTGLLWDQVKECGENQDSFVTCLHKPEGCFGKEQEWLKYMLEQGKVSAKRIDLVKEKIAES